MSTESSTRTRISRLWNKNRSAMSPSRARASRLPRQMGSPPALPDVMTRARNAGGFSGNISG